MSPTSSEPVTSAPRCSPPSAIRATISCSAAASQSSTFIETCTWPAPGSARPSARTPGKPPVRSRTASAISRAASSEPRRFTLNAISGRRAPTITPPTAGSIRARPEVGLELAGVDPRLQPVEAAAPVERRPAHRRRVDEHRQPERAEPLAERRAPPARARSMSDWRSATSGTTSATPIRGCAPSCWRRSIRSRATSTAATSASTSGPSSPTTVNTERLWSASACTSSTRACADSASPIASIVARSRPSEKFGTDSSGSTLVL